MNPKLQKLNTLMNIYTIIGIIILMISLTFIMIPLFPYVYYSVNAQATNDELKTIKNDLIQAQDQQKLKDKNETDENTFEKNLPKIDYNLSTENRVEIPSIGVNTKIIEDSNAKNGLYKGVWREPEFKTPILPGITVLAAHRYGYTSWSSDFRKKSSFRNLDKVKLKDKIYINWQQRRFEYQVYKISEDTTITDYNGDLILYTCKILGKSDIRIFIYAKRI